MSLVHSIFLALLSHNIGWKPRHQEQRTTKHVAQIGVLFKGSLSMESIHSKRCISLVDIYIGQVFISDFKHTHTHTHTHTLSHSFCIDTYFACSLFPMQYERLVFPKIISTPKISLFIMLVDLQTVVVTKFAKFLKTISCCTRQ